MRLPRDISGRVSDTPSRDKRAAIFVSQPTERGEHHVAVPDHASLRVGTLSSILNDVAQHHGLTREELVSKLFA